MLRTSNKKYFKRIDIPELKLHGIAMDQTKISWKYQNETLLIAYLKPEVIMEEEAIKIEAFKKNSPESGEMMFKLK